jgi:hypothetical protein
MSSTPFAAAFSRTFSMTSWRTSGLCIGGSGIERSSKAMVSFMPGKRSSWRGSIFIGSRSARSMATFGSASGSIGPGG